MSVLDEIGRTRVMGIVNVTPDSFSDGGRWATPEEAVAHARQLVTDGADLVDIGGESTRPGASRPPLEEELARVLPVVEALARDGVAVSVDTMRSEVASAAVEAGAVVINDVSGGLADPRILEVAAGTGVVYIAMHWRAHSRHMQDFAVYDGPGGVVGTVTAELSERVDAALAAGIPDDRLVLDPGLGFAKESGHNWELLAALEQLEALGFPLLVGASRKRFLGGLLAEGGEPRPVDQREDANVALTTYLALHGIWGVRVHDARASRDAVRVVERLRG